jgi:hypothetical protein
VTDGSFVELLRVAMDAELSRRRKLDYVNTIDDVVNLIKSSERIIILAGAGTASLSQFVMSRNKYELWYSRFPIRYRNIRYASRLWP